MSNKRSKQCPTIHTRPLARRFQEVTLPVKSNWFSDAFVFIASIAFGSLVYVASAVCVTCLLTFFHGWFLLFKMAICSVCEKISKHRTLKKSHIANPKRCQGKILDFTMLYTAFIIHTGNI